jgi:hypothetical protein
LHAIHVLGPLDSRAKARVGNLMQCTLTLLLGSAPPPALFSLLTQEKKTVQTLAGKLINKERGPCLSLYMRWPRVYNVTRPILGT